MFRVCLRFQDQTGCHCVLEPRPAVCHVMRHGTLHSLQEIFNSLAILDTLSQEYTYRSRFAVNHNVPGKRTLHSHTEVLEHLSAVRNEVYVKRTP